MIRLVSSTGDYAVIRVPGDVQRHDEVLGTKPKFWYAAGGSGRPDMLFKDPRHNEDWSEKLAAELAGLLGLPHATYELAVHADRASGIDLVGVVSRSFVAPGQALVHGNEVLAELDPAYPRDAKRGAYPHTVERVMRALAPFDSAVPGMNARQAFIGYLLLDAWIGNTDRHHENWGIVATAGAARLAPTFDHATSLGRELTEADASDRLTPGDHRRTVAAYIDKARSAFYAPNATEGDRCEHPLEAWRRGAALEPAAALRWREALEMINHDAVVGCIERIPADRMSASHRTLAGKILEMTRMRIIND